MSESQNGHELSRHELAYLGGVLAVQGYRLVQIEPAPSREPGSVHPFVLRAQSFGGPTSRLPQAAPRSPNRPWRQSGVIFPEDR